MRSLTSQNTGTCTCGRRQVSSKCVRFHQESSFYHGLARKRLWPGSSRVHVTWLVKSPWSHLEWDWTLTTLAHSDYSNIIGLWAHQPANYMYSQFPRVQCNGIDQKIDTVMHVLAMSQGPEHANSVKSEPNELDEPGNMFKKSVQLFCRLTHTLLRGVPSQIQDHQNAYQILGKELSSLSMKTHKYLRCIQNSQMEYDPRIEGSAVASSDDLRSKHKRLW